MAPSTISSATSSSPTRFMSGAKKKSALLLQSEHRSARTRHSAWKAAKNSLKSRVYLKLDSGQSAMCRVQWQHWQHYTLHSEIPIHEGYFDVWELRRAR